MELGPCRDLWEVGKGNEEVPDARGTKTVSTTGGTYVWLDPATGVEEEHFWDFSLCCPSGDSKRHREALSPSLFGLRMPPPKHIITIGVDATPKRAGGLLVLPRLKTVYFYSIPWSPAFNFEAGPDKFELTNAYLALKLFSHHIDSYCKSELTSDSDAIVLKTDNWFCLQPNTFYSNGKWKELLDQANLELNGWGVRGDWEFANIRTDDYILIADTLSRGDYSKVMALPEVKYMEIRLEGYVHNNVSNVPEPFLDMIAAMTQDKDEHDREKNTAEVPRLDDEGNSPLHLAINKKDEELVLQLLQDGVDANAKNNRLETPLHRASLLDDKDISWKLIKILEENGADLAVENWMKETFLHNFIQTKPAPSPKRFHSITKYIIGKNHSKLFSSPNAAMETPLMLAVENLWVKRKTLTVLETNGVNFNAVNQCGDSVLFYAVEGGRYPVVLSKLIELGADAHHINEYGRSLLHFAAIKTDVAAMNLFLDLGLKPNATDIYGDTPLHFTMLGRRTKEVTKMIKLLTKNGANGTLRNDWGDVPFEHAMNNPHIRNVEQVVEDLRNFRI